MRYTIISGLVFSITNDRQVVNMGGPVIGTLSFNDKKISDDCIVDNLVLDQLRKRLFFIKNHSTSKWRSGIYFTIAFYELEGGEISEFARHFDILYLKKFINETQLEIFNALHDKNLDRRAIFDVENESKVT
ncbi:hypothetical protein SNE25_24405 [Mucilaginibacter sabulilitoris]|uniref:Uncharacterized protein n=1 Tax=Mucilaginibacter sabulilitoris TaxID=1173583 RepID=A0ABZ0TH15_9SPHI|nr:hypothetical protein [Mucilaginibacter sabulilitoris]WPU92474.1 hypothetical protein SNE25_24405 [Mucilaginibacter sabulilitoris]